MEESLNSAMVKQEGQLADGVTTPVPRLHSIWCRDSQAINVPSQALVGAAHVDLAGAVQQVSSQGIMQAAGAMF